MKLTALITAGALAVGSFAAAAPADAQRHGYRDGYRGGDYRPYRGGRNFRPYRGYNRGIYRGYNRGYGRGYYGGRGFYGRPRVACRIVRGYYGTERRCFRRF